MHYIYIPDERSVTNSPRWRSSILEAWFVIYVHVNTKWLGYWLTAVVWINWTKRRFRNFYLNIENMKLKHDLQKNPIDSTAI